ncbi:hypothetical protein [Falsirhodobacter deserti]|uniref:hypothetical protein n=1 Tax=Falsirhodobacter deserti TaxID=1365611 RepID=UPI000FE41CB5|nr:hypothetical protein [Falsirhodobacter deserti]
MLEYLPDHLREDLRQAAKKRRRGSRLHIQLGDVIYPLQRLWATGLAIEAGRLTHLRGLVDVYDGPRHLGHCLIVASVLEEDELICDFKYFQTVADRPPVDFERTGEEISGYLASA